MRDIQLTQTIRTGGDPRDLPEFNAIREEINKANHPSQPELNWMLVESLALTLFKNNGVDLHTVTYYTLARTRIHGLGGFCEGVELQAALISREWDKLWPQNPQARTEMLDWFNSRIGNILRQQLSYSPTDLPLMYRAERALQIICDKLQQVELKKIPRVENLLFFVQNTRKRFELTQQKNNATPPAQPPVKTLIYAPEGTDTVAETLHFPAPEMTVKVHPGTAGASNTGKVTGSTLKGFMAGIGCSLIFAAVFWWWQVYPIQQQLTQVKDTSLGTATIWLASPNLSDYGRNLHQLLDASSMQPLETGMQMVRTADSRWPESLQQQQATALWHETLKERAQRSPQLKGWQQTRQDLRAFADLIMQREKEGLTLSYIKNVIWQAERTLNEETPLESLLTQYQTARSQGQNTQAQEKEINERLNDVLSRWLLIKNNAMPENATDSRSGK
ncbi:type VI secretion system ImpA family N-terminal domain-containing protein [Salmonella enterica]|nr:hypothetical protein [Salmonella enterica]EBA5087533.1 hypothetical protein [Salmonella enterica]ELJ2159750.1 type VI secretion system ImpA family N-terminal domain-containing protein [Salmonella enterica]